jgi:alkylation response protein AidB-like acyl-CoA dehydrogenase
MASTANAPDGAHFLEAARDLAPKIIELRAAIERERTLPSELVTTMANSGFFSIWRALAFGGPELGFPDFARVIEELSRADGSVGWCTMVAVVLSRLSGYLDEKVAREIFGDTTTIVAGSINPSGKAVAVPGGFRVTGRWSYGSFIQHSKWTVGNSIVHEGDAPRRDANGAPDIRFMFMPTREVEILDNWYVSASKALAATTFRFTISSWPRITHCPPLLRIRHSQAHFTLRLSFLYSRRAFRLLRSVSHARPLTPSLS